MRKNTRFLILGGGISGLALAWFLREEKDVILLEKESRVGGWMQTENTSDFLFEKGPRTFKSSRSQLLLDLAEEVGIADKIIYSDPSASARFLWFRNRLHKLPAPFLPTILRSFLTEWYQPKTAVEDESIHDFISRRLGARVADYLFDPLTLGIYAGDSRVLSIKSCFPKLKEWEEEFGSLTKGFFLSKKEKKQKPKGSLFSFQSGVQTLIDALQKHLSSNILCNQHIKEIKFHDDGVEVKTDTDTFFAEQVFSTLPAPVIGALLKNDLFLSIPEQQIKVVNIGYKQNVNPKKGFGYLIPTAEKEKAMGVVFDSCIFPQQNKQAQETRFTVMLHDGGEKEALQTLQNHLQIRETPDLIHSFSARIPQYHVGHLQKMAAIEKLLQEKYPRLRCLGSYTYGVSVSSCIAGAKAIKESLID